MRRLLLNKQCRWAPNAWHRAQLWEMVGTAEAWLVCRADCHRRRRPRARLPKVTAAVQKRAATFSLTLKMRPCVSCLSQRNAGMSLSLQQSYFGHCMSGRWAQPAAFACKMDGLLPFLSCANCHALGVHTELTQLQLRAWTSLPAVLAGCACGALRYAAGDGRGALAAAQGLQVPHRWAFAGVSTRDVRTLIAKWQAVLRSTRTLFHHQP